MNAKAELLAAFDRSPGSAYDKPGALRSLAASHRALGVLAAIEAGSSLEAIRATIAGLPDEPAQEASPEVASLPAEKKTSASESEAEAGQGA